MYLNIRPQSRAGVWFCLERRVSDSGLFSSDYYSQPRHDLHFSASLDELTNGISSWRSGGTRLMQSTVPGSCVVLGYFIARCGGGMSGSLACSELRILLLTYFANNGASVLTTSRVQPLQPPASRFEAALTSQTWAGEVDPPVEWTLNSWCSTTTRHPPLAHRPSFYHITPYGWLVSLEQTKLIYITQAF